MVYESVTGVLLRALLAFHLLFVVCFELFFPNIVSAPTSLIESLSPLMVGRRLIGRADGE